MDANALKYLKDLKDAETLDKQTETLIRSIYLYNPIRIWS